MDIRPVDVDDDVSLRAAYDLDTRSSLHGRPDAPHWTWQQMAAEFRSPNSGERHLLLGGYDDGALVAIAILFVPLLDNLDKCWVFVHVDPPRRRQGHGRAMLDHITEIATATEARTVLCTEATIPFDRVTDHPYRRFAENAGWDYSNVEVVRQLDLPVAAADLASWAAHAAERGGGYRVETYVDTIPEHYLDGYCHLLGLLGVGAPTGEVDWEEERFTPQRLAESRVALAAGGRHAYDSLAISPEGLVVAHSTCVVPTEGRPDVNQWGTYVHREHRGHRLGLATKVANLAAVQRDHPQMRRVVTQNAETNRWMIAINEEIGFEPVEVSMEFVRRA